MSYLVMECHTSYAVVLDQNGRFLKVANLNYQVGQQISEVVIMQGQKTKGLRWKKHLSMLASAACICLLLLGAGRFLLTPVGTVQMSINPEVLILVNRLDYVIGLEGMNEDGEKLAGDVWTWGKKIEELTDELSDRAVEMGYLRDGGRITLTVDSSDKKWKTATEDLLVLELEIHFEHRIQIITDRSQVPKEQPKEEEKDKDEPTVIIPVKPGKEQHTGDTPALPQADGDRTNAGNSGSMGNAWEDEDNDDEDHIYTEDAGEGDGREEEDESDNEAYEGYDDDGNDSDDENDYEIYGEDNDDDPDVDEDDHSSSDDDSDDD